MMASRSLSIYLLKAGREPDKALRNPERYEETSQVQKIGEDSRIFLQRGSKKSPWWKEFLQIDATLNQETNSAIAFVKAEGHWFALAFGAGGYFLDDYAYEHDFGTLCVLNAVDPSRLKSADTLEPNSTLRIRAQTPTDADLAALAMGENSILKTLTGRAREEYSTLIRSVTGASNVRITTPTGSSELGTLLKKLYDLYSSTDYTTTFPALSKIIPVRDPGTLDTLNAKAVEAVLDSKSSIILTIPQIVNYEDETYISFTGHGRCPMYDDIYIKQYREYVQADQARQAKRGLTPKTPTFETLVADRLQLLSSDGERRASWSIFKCLILDLSVDAEHTYHLSDGIWYQVQNDLIKSLKAHLDRFWDDTDLPENFHPREDAYNEYASSVLANATCLDKQNISPQGQTQIEPCDILRLKDHRADLVHVKFSTSSSTLSHLFNQASNSARLLRTNSEAVENLKAMLPPESNGAGAAEVQRAIKSGEISVTIAIISHKRSPEKKSDNLPLFSRISLSRTLNDLRSMKVDTSIQLVPNENAISSKSKPRKKKL